MEDSGDRAAKYRKAGGHFRMPLSRIGFDPRNRGGLGVSPRHAHEIAWDGTDPPNGNGVTLRRYKEVEVVEVPQDLLPWINWT